MAFYGADIEQMQQLEQTLRQQAEALQNIMSTIRSRVQATDWRGPDADRFRSQWDTTHTQNLNRVVSELQQVADTVRSNWMQQQQVSQGG